MNTLRLFAAMLIISLSAPLLMASDLISKRPNKWLLHLKSGSPMATSFWVELSEAGAIRLSRKEAADREYKNAYEGAIGGDVASKIYDLASQTLTNFHFPKRDTGSCDGTNIELSLIFHQRAMTVEFIALDAPQSAGRSVEMIFKILNSKLPEGSRIW